MQLKQLTYFIEIIRCQSLSQAARELYISQPSLSQTIRNLEEELGFPLLIRTSQGVVPTEMGRRVYRDARKIVDEAAQMIEAWKTEYALSQTLEGTVRVVAVPSSYPMVAEKSLPTIKAAYPGIKCLVMEARRFEILQYLTEHKADLGVSNVVSHEQEDFMAAAQAQNLHIVPLLEDSFQIVISSKNPLVYQEQVTQEDLKRLSLVIYSGQDTIGMPYYKKYFSQENTLYVNSNEKMIRLVASDQAVAALPIRITQHCQVPDLKGRVRFLQVEGVCLAITHYLAWRADEALPPKTARVRDIIKDAYSEVNETA